MSIKKKIHYCWFGGNPLPEKETRCLASWRKLCPDYDIVLWNEQNFDVNSHPFTKQAYAAKKYAFVSDYVRLKALYEQGGIYLDADVELIKSLDDYLRHQAFSGFEDIDTVPTGIIASEQGNHHIKALLDHYDEVDFLDKNGKPNLEANVIFMTKYFVNKGLKLNNQYQDIDGFIFYPKEYFCPKDYRDAYKIKITDNTVAIHHFSSSWRPWHQRLKMKIMALVGSKNAQRISSIKRKLRSRS